MLRSKRTGTVRRPVPAPNTASGMEQTHLMKLKFSSLKNQTPSPSSPKSLHLWDLLVKPKPQKLPTHQSCLVDPLTPPHFPAPQIYPRVSFQTNNLHHGPVRMPTSHFLMEISSLMENVPWKLVQSDSGFGCQPPPPKTTQRSPGTTQEAGDATAQGEHLFAPPAWQQRWVESGKIPDK